MSASSDDELLLIEPEPEPGADEPCVRAALCAVTRRESEGRDQAASCASPTGVGVAQAPQAVALFECGLDLGSYWDTLPSAIAAGDLSVRLIEPRTGDLMVPVAALDSGDIAADSEPVADTYSCTDLATSEEEEAAPASITLASARQGVHHASEGTLLSAYELQRRNTIARNHSRLRELGLEPRDQQLERASARFTRKRQRPPTVPAPEARVERSRELRPRCDVTDAVALHSERVAPSEVISAPPNDGVSIPPRTPQPQLATVQRPPVPPSPPPSGPLGPSTQATPPLLSPLPSCGVPPLLTSSSPPQEHIVWISHPERCEHDIYPRSRCKKCCPNAKKRAARPRCEHGRQPSQCKECGGAGLCVHGRVRCRCKDCGGKGLCEHGRLRFQCKQCNGSQVCAHGRNRSRCSECGLRGTGGGNLCQHGRQKYQCTVCVGGGVCIHRRMKSRCPDCGGSGICVHGKRHDHCSVCGGGGLCGHQIQRHKCSRCRAARLLEFCKHGERLDRACALCDAMISGTQSTAES